MLHSYRKTGRAAGAMSDLQAVLEFQVELFKFFNIDLFQRGSVCYAYILDAHYVKDISFWIVWPRRSVNLY